MAKIAVLLALLFLRDDVECVSQCVSRYSPYFRGYYMKVMDCPGATLRNSTLPDSSVVCCVFDSGIVPSIPQNINVSVDVYLNMVGDTTRTRALYPFYMQALSAAGISGKQEIAAFTAQILYHTSGMNFTEENSNGEEYKGLPSLGNSVNGGRDDTRKYISRGFLPLIGRHMYQLASSSVNSKIKRQPERVAFPSTGFQVAAWLWQNGYTSADNSSLPTGNLGRFFNGTEYSFVELYYIIQKRNSGIEKLFHYWRHATKVLGVPCPPSGESPVCRSGIRKGRCKLATSCKGEYISQDCPLPSPIACCLDCQNPVDLAFVVDSSGSVKEPDFRIGLDFIVKVCQFFDIGYPEGTKIALVRFSSSPNIIFHFNTYVNKNDVLDAIRATTYVKGGTRTDLALLMAHEQIFGNPTNGVRPKELGVPRVLVLLTDGKSTSGMGAIVNSSTLLREDGVNIFVIAIGKNINKEELNIIASDPDADHVVSSNTFAEINNMVEKMRESSCYEPALLEEEEELMSNVEQNSLKYYKYDLQNTEGINTLFFERFSEGGDVSMSMSNKNPRNYHLDLGFCRSDHGNKFTNSGGVFGLEELESNDFCNLTANGGCTKPRFVSQEEFMQEGIIVYIRRCSSRWFYVSIEGTNRTNTFNLTLFKDFIRIKAKVENTTEIPENKTTTFPIPKNVYVGVAVATIGTTATVAAVVTVSCAKEFQMKGSTKTKKKKKEKNRADKTNNNAAINKGFEDDDNVRLVSFENHTSPTPLIENYEQMSNGRSSSNATRKEKKLPENGAIGQTHVDEMETNKINRETSSCSPEDRKRKSSLQTVTIANTSKTKRPTPHSQMSVVSSMIHGLQREDTYIEETVTSVTPACKGKETRVQKSALIKRQITSTSVAVLVDTPQEGQDRNDQIKKMGGQAMKQNCEMLLKGLGSNTETDLTNRTGNGSNDKSKVLSKHSNYDTLDTRNSSLLQSPKSSQLSNESGKSDEETICCFNWQPSLSSNKVKGSDRNGNDAEEIDLEKNQAETKQEEKRDKGTFLSRLKAKLTWRKVLAVLCPCFTYYILDKENTKTQPENEKEDGEKERSEMRSRRFERDMQMTQASCVLLSQLLFLSGVDARDDKIACAVVAITMNYLSLVTVCWLIVQALYLFSFTRRTDSETKQRMKINLYYASAWGLPLLAVALLASKYDTYSKHPHCWISFSDALSWSVATPMITLGLVQVILVILLVKALIAYRKSADGDENEDRKNVIKSGLKTVVCITITVLVTWFLGSLSLNIDRDVYHTFFTIFNALQGFAFFLFYVVLNPQVRQIILAIWEWKQSAVTPFDEHEAIEIEEEENKDKKKAKGKKKSASYDKYDEENTREKETEERSNAKTVLNVAGAKMAPASIVNNKKRNQENVSLVKFVDKKETRKISWGDTPTDNQPIRKLPPITRPRKISASNEVQERRRKISVVQGYTPETPKDRVSKGGSSPKGKRLHSSSPSSSDQQRLTSPYQNKKTTQFEFKDNLPVAAFSPSPSFRPRTAQLKLDAITTQPSQSPKSKVKKPKPVSKKKTSKGRKT